MVTGHTEPWWWWVVSAGPPWTVRSVLQTKVHEVVILVVLMKVQVSLVSHLVSPLLHGLHGGGVEGRLGDLPHGGSHEGPGLWQSQAVSHLWWGGHWSHGGTHRHGVVCGQSSSHGGGSIRSDSSRGVRVGDSTVQENLSLGVGRGDSKNNLRL